MGKREVWPNVSPSEIKTIFSKALAIARALKYEWSRRGKVYKLMTKQTSEEILPLVDDNSENSGTYSHSVVPNDSIRYLGALTYLITGDSINVLNDKFQQAL